jgi:type I restriction enzyme S subunit
MSFPRYPKYKDSGVEWLGQVPEHWEVLRLKPILYEVDERIGDRDALLLGLSKTAGVLPRADIGQNASESDDYSKYKECRVGDLVMNKMQAWNGVFGLSTHTGIVSPDYAVFRFRDQRFATFLTNAFRTDLAAGEFFCRCRGMGTAFLRLNTGDFLDTKITLPPASEVPRITAFLDRETAKIDALIAEQERLIELLQEKRQAVISHAVTKGLNAEAPMKDSGVEWLGAVPEHWDFGPLKRFWEVIDCKHVTVPFLDEGYPVASVMEVREFELDLRQVLQTSEEHFRLLTEGGRQPRRGDVIYCRNTANTGTSAYVGTDEPLSIGQDVVLIKSMDHNGRFLNYILHSGLMAAQLETLLVGSTFKRINVAQIRSLAVTCPPKAEQDAITAFLDAQTSDYTTLSADASRAITLLQERRSALISAAVTGQIDVRNYFSEAAA